MAKNEKSSKRVKKGNLGFISCSPKRKASDLLLDPAPLFFGTFPAF